jgi:hypothetical protein
MARALFEEHETQRIRPGLAGGVQILLSGDAADFYANSHRSELSGKAKCAGYRMWVRYSPAAPKVGAANVRSGDQNLVHPRATGPAPTWTRQPVRLHRAVRETVDGSRIEDVARHSMCARSPRPATGRHSAARKAEKSCCQGVPPPGSSRRRRAPVVPSDQPLVEPDSGGSATHGGSRAGWRQSAREIAHLAPQHATRRRVTTPRTQAVSGRCVVSKCAQDAALHRYR